MPRAIQGLSCPSKFMIDSPKPITLREQLALCKKNKQKNKGVKVTSSVRINKQLTFRERRKEKKNKVSKLSHQNLSPSVISSCSVKKKNMSWLTHQNLSVPHSVSCSCPMEKKMVSSPNSISFSEHCLQDQSRRTVCYDWLVQTHHSQWKACILWKRAMCHDWLTRTHQAVREQLMLCETEHWDKVQTKIHLSQKVPHTV